MLVCSTIDREADALYLQLRKGEVARTEELDDWTLVDVDANGAPLGIEIIHVARFWPLHRFIERYQVAPDLVRLLEQFLPQRNHRVMMRDVWTKPTTTSNAKVLPVKVLLAAS